MHNIDFLAALTQYEATVVQFGGPNEQSTTLLALTLTLNGIGPHNTHTCRYLVPSALTPGLFASLYRSARTAYPDVMAALDLAAPELQPTQGTRPITVVLPEDLADQIAQAGMVEMMNTSTWFAMAARAWLGQADPNRRNRIAEIIRLNQLDIDPERIAAQIVAEYP